MSLRRTLICVGVLIGALGLFLFLTLFFIRDRQLEALAVRALQQEGYFLNAAKFSKAFPLGIKAEGLEIRNDSGLLLKADKASLRVSFLPLLAGRLKFVGQLVIGLGTAAIEYVPKNGNTGIVVDGISLENLPFIKTVSGAQAKGAVHIKAEFTGKGKGLTGQLQVEIKGANISDVKIGGLPLPNADYKTVQGMVRANGGVLSISSFTLYGDGIYVRLKGSLPIASPLNSAPLNLVLELMPKPEFLEKQKLVFLLMTKYQPTPGRFEIPVTGTLGMPLIQ